MMSMVVMIVHEAWCEGAGSVVGVADLEFLLLELRTEEQTIFSFKCKLVPGSEKEKPFRSSYL